MDLLCHRRNRVRAGLGFASFLFSLSLAAAPVIAPKLAAPTGIDDGALLWNELNCAACHAGASGGARVSPVLGKEGLQLTPQYLRSYLAEPEAAKPGTTMPDILGQLDPAQRAEAAEALTHFLAHVPSENDRSVATQPGKIAQGRRLFHTIGCVACHSPEESWQAVGGATPNVAIDADLTGSNSIPIGNLASKTTVPELASFLRDPLKYRKSGRMPSLNLGETESEAIAMYLLRAQASDPASKMGAVKTLAGLSYEYYEADFNGGDPDWDALKPVSSGTVDTINIQNKRRDQNFGFRFSGLINASSPGSYKFWLNSDDGSRLWIDSKLVVDNGGVHAPQEKSGSIDLTTGLHTIVVTFYNAEAGSELRALWQAPGGGRRQPIPADALSHAGQPMLPVGSGPFARDPAKAEKGKALFASLGCAACHAHEDVPAPRPPAKAFNDLAATGGCLAPAPVGKAPNFHLNPPQRTALETHLRQRGAKPPVDPALERMASLNCVACHTRDGKGGPSNARLQYFVGIGEGDLGDEGRIPPHLTKVGQKLRRDWMETVLLKAGSVRRYMGARMPQFGAGNVADLPMLFEKVDGSETKPEPSTSARDEKFGRKLVGAGGVSCVSCHTFASHKSLGINVMDLSMMTQRLKKEWFHRYLIDPASLRPGTRMPSFWPNGEAVNKDILDGNTDAQINAIWAYLSRGRDADLPPGLVTGKKEIVATTEAVIYRNFIKGAGARAIAVGYPEKANLAFDANILNVAEIWQGAFMDAARHSSGRGEGFEPPLGDRIYQLPAGAPLAVLSNADAPWPAATGHAAGYQMRGYRLDEKQRPAFHYTFGNVDVEDFPIALQGEIDPYFKRALTFKSTAAPQNLFCRVAVGDKIEAKADNSFVVDGRVTFKLTGAAAMVRKAEGKFELLAPVAFKNGQAQIVEEIHW